MKKIFFWDFFLYFCETFFCVFFWNLFRKNIFLGRRFFGSEGRFGHRRVCAVVSARFQEKKVDDRKYFSILSGFWVDFGGFWVDFCRVSVH